MDNKRNERIKVFEDEGFSGKNTLRPAFQEMMELVKRNQITYIVVYRLDIISRQICASTNRNF